MLPFHLLSFLLVGYTVTVFIETPVLLLGLSPCHTLGRRVFAGVWLTACTYPIVVLVLPVIFAGYSRALYLGVAETFAPAAECGLFYLAFLTRETPGEIVRRDCLTIVLANLLSFGLGEVFHYFHWLDWAS